MITTAKNNIDKVLPPKEKKDAIEQSERYEKEYEMSRKKLDEILMELERLKKELEELEK